MYIVDTNVVNIQCICMIYTYICALYCMYLGVTITNEVWLKYITGMKMFVEVQICKSTLLSSCII